MLEHTGIRHLQLVTTDDAPPPITRVEPLTECVFEWHGLVEHEPGETPCCHQRIEVTNLVTAHHDAIVHDVATMLSLILHEWGNGCNVTMLVRIAPPAPPEAPQRPL